MPGELTLHEVADRLGVHYMTAYRYVRLGLLPARKVGATWQVRASDLERFTPPAAERSARAGRRGRPAGRDTRRDLERWVERLAARLVAGDERAASAVVDAALGAGLGVEDAYVDLVAPAMRRIGDGWERGDFDVADEHRATVVADRVLGRLAGRLARPGRRRGTVVIGCVQGERHALGSTMVADLVRAAGFDVDDLGADVPLESFVHAARGADGLVALGVSVTTEGLDKDLRATVGALRDACPGVPVLIGGGAVASGDDAVRLGGDAWAPDARAAAELVRSLR